MPDLPEPSKEALAVAVEIEIQLALRSCTTRFLAQMIEKAARKLNEDKS